jgi:predicted RNA-binding Zn-ribbon protein involved in translation (DUF1610 family)
MSETQTFDAIIVRRGDYRELKQGIVYRAGVAVEYRCPDCGETHPLDRRDWDEARGVYAGRRCGEGARMVRVRANSNAYNRRRYREDAAYRARKLASDRARRATLRAATVGQ